MKTIMARNPNDSFSFSRRYFNWRKKIEEEEDDDREEILTFRPEFPDRRLPALDLAVPRRRTAVSKLRSALTFSGKRRTGDVSAGLGTRVVGTLFGHRRGHVLFAFQEDPRAAPAFLVELAMPTSGLVREMASGMVRVALECERRRTGKKPGRILDEPVWRTYCNGRKCGFAVKRECGPDEWKVLNTIGPVSMGAGVLPAKDSGGIKPDGEVMYMRAKFERVVGSKDSEAFYMMNPDGHGGPELSFYLLRV